MILIRRALENPDPGASNGGSNFIFRHFGADMAAFEVAGCPRISDLSRSNSDENRRFDAIFTKKLSYGLRCVARY